MEVFFSFRENRTFKKIRIPGAGTRGRVLGFHLKTASYTVHLFGFLFFTFKFITFVSRVVKFAAINYGMYTSCRYRYAFVPIMRQTLARGKRFFAFYYYYSTLARPSSVAPPLPLYRFCNENTAGWVGKWFFEPKVVVCVCVCTCMSIPTCACVPV